MGSKKSTRSSIQDTLDKYLRGLEILDEIAKEPEIIEQSVLAYEANRKMHPFFNELSVAASLNSGNDFAHFGGACSYRHLVTYNGHLLYEVHRAGLGPTINKVIGVDSEYIKKLVAEFSDDYHPVLGTLEGVLEFGKKDVRRCLIERAKRIIRNREKEDLS